MPYPPQGNGYTTIQSVPNNFNQQRPNNVRKVGKHEDEEAGKLFVGGLRYENQMLFITLGGYIFLDKKVSVGNCSRVVSSCDKIFSVRCATYTWSYGKF